MTHKTSHSADYADIAKGSHVNYSKAPAKDETAIAAPALTPADLVLTMRGLHSMEFIYNSTAMAKRRARLIENRGHAKVSSES